MKTKGKAYESYAWMHHLYGRYGINDGNPLDAVIPNFYRPDDFAVGDDQGYLLFVGRQIRRKGIEHVVEIARRMKMPLIIAGQGGRIEDGNLVCDDPTVVPLGDVRLTMSARCAHRNAKPCTPGRPARWPRPSTSSRGAGCSPKRCCPGCGR